MMSKFFVIFAICGVLFGNCPGSSSEISTRAFRSGGKLASIESFPYHVSLYYNIDTPCSGAIISEHWVLTAATCFKNPLSDNATIRAGSTSRVTEGSEHEIDNIIIHPKRNSTINLYRYDIALVYVKNPFNFDKIRQPISMFEIDEKVTPGLKGVLAGWGGFLGQQEEYLHTEELTISPRIACDLYYNENEKVDLQDEVCVTYEVENGENPCTGDYGSPVTVDGRLAAIVALRIMYCGTERPNIPTFHTEVAPYRSWIKAVTGI